MVIIMVYRIGTRGSKLALAQTEIVRQRLAQHFPEHRFEPVIIRTTGDKFGSMPMKEIGARGLFIKEIEESLLEGRIDLAVHSMKDMPVEQPQGLTLANMWEREDPRDVLILREKASLAELPFRGVIGTGSMRRKVQLLKLRPDLQIVDIRGNVETRIRKMEEQKLDGIVLAAAGLKRLHLEEKVTHYFDYHEMLPAPAQGALAIEAVKERKDVMTMLNQFGDEKSARTVAAERHFLELVGGGCQKPVGAIAQIQGENICLKVMCGEETGENIVFAQAVSRDAASAAREAAKLLHRQQNI